MQIESLQLSHSSLGLLHSCARKLEFRKFYKHSRREESQAMSLGTALHNGYQNFLKTGDVEESIGAYMISYPIKYQTTAGAAKSLEAGYATLLAMMQFDELGRYELAMIKTANGVQPAIEVPFQIVIKNFSLSDEKNIPVTYVGFIDIVLYDKLDDCYIVVDIKTTSRKLDDMTPIYKFDPQCLPYAMVLERLLGQELDNLDMKYLVANIDINAPKVRVYSFPKTKTDVQDWAQGLLNDLYQLKAYYNAGWFPRNANGCYAWNRPCQFFDYCASRDPNHIENMLAFNDDKGEDRKIDFWITMDLEMAA